METDKPKNNMHFVITWKVVIFAIIAFVAVRITLLLAENFLQLGMSEMLQVILTGIFGTLATFAYARKRQVETEE